MKALVTSGAMILSILAFLPNTSTAAGGGGGSHGGGGGGGSHTGGGGGGGSHMSMGSSGRVGSGGTSHVYSGGTGSHYSTGGSHVYSGNAGHLNTGHLNTGHINSGTLSGHSGSGANLHKNPLSHNAGPKTGVNHNAGPKTITKNPGPKLTNKPGPNVAHDKHGDQHGDKHGDHHDGHWDKDHWNHVWYRHWYHHHPIWWNNGWYWWDPYVNEYVVWVEGVTIPEDVYVQEAGAGVVPAAAAPIRIVNPPDCDTTLNYAVNDYTYEIKPGETQELTQDRTWVIEFDRGGDFGSAQYTLEPGTYTFASTDKGWELYHQAP